MSMLKKLFDKLDLRQAERKAAIVRGFHELAIALADEEDVKPDEAESILEAAGKSTAELAAAVELIHERRKLQAIIAEEPAIAIEPEKLDREQAAADAEYTKATEKWRKARAAIGDRRSDHESSRMAIDNAKARLRETASPEARAADAQFSAELAKLNRRRQFLREQLGLMGPGSDVRVTSHYGVETFAKNVGYRRGEYQGITAPRPDDNLHLAGSKRQKQIREAEEGLRAVAAEEKRYREELTTVDAQLAKLQSGPGGRELLDS